MDKVMVEEFTKRLEAERRLLEDELASLGIADVHAPDGWDAMSSNIDTAATETDEVADRIEEIEQNKAQIHSLTMQKKNVDRALAKIAEGTYGICEVSGELIEEERLAANPSARTCKEHVNAETSIDN